MKINQVEKVAPWPFSVGGDSGLAWSEMYGSVFCLVLRLVRSSQDKPSQHASEGNLSLPLPGSGSGLGEGKTFCFAFKRKLKRHAAKQQAAEIKCK